MTLKKLAQLANASVSTVSKAFSGKGDISDATREHIFAVAREHGCFQQFYHMPYDRPVVAVIIPEAISNTYIRYVEALRKLLEQNSYTMLLSISNFDPQMLQELVRYYVEHNKVDGLVIIGGTASLPPDCKTALISVAKTAECGACISSLLRPGLEACLRQLYDMGHRRFAYVGEPLVESKRITMEEILDELGVAICPAHMICSHRRFEEAGRDGMRRILASGMPPPTAVIGGYGYVTAGILEELSERGISVPEEISVVSINADGLPSRPGLEVAGMPDKTEQECEAIIRLLNERVGSERPNQPCTLDFPTTFRPGTTVAPPLHKNT